jgi:NAD(P)-dependent dehydrogenase (short-subunit alcohol dehydrogenase family)
VAIQYAADGCKRIAVADISMNGLKQTQKEIVARYPNTSVKAILVDVRSKESVQAMVDATVNEFGRLDYCVNSAGVIKFGDTVTLSEEDFEFVYEVNLRGTFFCVKAEVTAMLRQESLSTR